MAKLVQQTKALDENGKEILVGDTVEYGSTYEHTGEVSAVLPATGCPHVRVQLKGGGEYYAHVVRVVEEL